MRFGLLVRNPLVGVQISPPRIRRRNKPYITPEQFDALVNLMQGPYATMVSVCVLAGLRVNELIGLKWVDVHSEALTIDERFSRGEWGCPKTNASSATIAVAKMMDSRVARAVENANAVVN